jgi:hypothetical protein
VWANAKVPRAKLSEANKMSEAKYQLMSEIFLYKTVVEICKDL